MTHPHPYTNRLIDETSPYLLQHAHNPVDWYAWGDEAFKVAKERNCPILLSVGYSACHWCHVMERESFENPDVADIMNRYFVNVKVDREERPDVDAIYMTVVQLLTGQGGWPMTVFLTPDGRPFYGGTYFPPHDMYGKPGFSRLLYAIAEAWTVRQAELEQQGTDIVKELERESGLGTHSTTELLTPAVLDNAYSKLVERFDANYGGFGGAPKFPQPDVLNFLLKLHARTRRQDPLNMVEKTLHGMALGGMYDQLGGGFHRYSTDATWLVPHFEKMLYDNAQLVQTYARAYQITRKPFYKGVAEETLEYVLREMTSPEGGFYSAQDADTEGVEGKFFVWSEQEVEALLGKRDAEVVAAFYDITPHGNWEEANILHVVKDARGVAKQFGLTLEETAEILDGARVKLFEHREKRTKPGLDDKILTAWNGLMLCAFAECALVFEREDFLSAALHNAEFVMSTLSFRDKEGYLRLLRTARNGTAKLNAYLEDYACYAEGLLWLYEATGSEQWLQTATELTETMLTYFWDAEHGGFFTTSSDHEALLHRPKDWDDNATPSGNSVAMEVLLRLSLLLGKSEYRERVAGMLRGLSDTYQKMPYGFSRGLSVLDFYLDSPKEIALLGDPSTPETQALRRVLYETYLPNRVVAHAKEATPEGTPLLAGRTLINGKPTAYVCTGFVCKEPVQTPEALRQQLK